MGTNLSQSTWTSLVTSSPASGAFNFSDTHASNASRFYRTLEQ
jgi:hypothetical protein